MCAKEKAGFFDSVIFRDPYIGPAVISVFGGWVQFCEATHQVWVASDASREERQRARMERRVAEGRRVLISGLSDEMLRAKQKEFEAAYRNAKREGRIRQHLPGHHEIENRNTVSTWTRGNLGETYSQRFFIADGASGYFVNTTFETATAQLITTLPELLNAAPVKPKALPPVERKALPQAPITTEEAEEGRRYWSDTIRELATSRSMPVAERRPMMAQETAKRIRELKRQAKMLTACDSEVDIEKEILVEV